MARVFITRAIPGEALNRLRAEHDVSIWHGRLPPSPSDLAKCCSEIEGLLSLLTDRIDSRIIDASPGLRAISNYAVGSDNVDLAAATERGIPVGVTPDVLTESTADFAFGLMIAAARQIVQGEVAVRSGDWITWEPAGWLGRDLHGRTLGIVGMGRIGQAVARRAEGFSMKVIHTSNSSGVPFEQLLEESDFISVHAPLTPETRGMFDEKAFKAMKDSAIIVNTARGAIIDTVALIVALEQGWIAGAGLDVTDPEPMPPDHPLLNAPNLVIAPHIASATHATREAMADIAVANLVAGLTGERMPHCANPQVYDGASGGPAGADNGEQ